MNNMMACLALPFGLETNAKSKLHESHHKLYSDVSPPSAPVERKNCEGCYLRPFAVKTCSRQ